MTTGGATAALGIVRERVIAVARGIGLGRVIAAGREIAVEPGTGLVQVIAAHRAAVAAPVATTPSRA
jgi:hypothetical protein